MRVAEQKIFAAQQKAKSVSRFKYLLSSYIQEIISTYRIGDTNITSDALAELTRALRRGYTDVAKDVLSFDYRNYKGVKEEVYQAIARAVDTYVIERVPYQTAYIAKTSDGWVQRITELAKENNWTEAETKIALANYLKGQRITVATTESQWVVETMRKAAVVAVTIPIQDGVEEIARLISIGDTSGARKLAKQMVALSKLPLSEKQGELLRYVTKTQEQLVNPLVQGEVLANLRSRAAQLSVSEKEWQIFGDKTRPSHVAADGQRVPIDEPFVLAGGLVQYPGDASLGADLSEIINCMCVAIYI